MRSIVVMTFVMTAALSAAAQNATPPATQCTVKVAPVIRGIKLGMSADEVLAMFPGSRENEMVKSALTAGENFASFGLTGFIVFPGQYPSKERFTGISSTTFTFVDGRLLQYGVVYDRPPWPHAADFINKIAAAFKLPPAEYWTNDQGGAKALSCDGFRVRTYVSNPGASITVMASDDPYKVQTERRAAFEEKARQEFRP
jgi:hypothetical protein